MKGAFEGQREFLDVSVALITHNRPVECAMAVQSLLFQTVLPRALLVFDNASSHRAMTPQMLALFSWAAEYGVKCRYEVRPALGMVAARIEAEALALQAGCEYLMAVDDDQVFQPRFLEESVLALDGFDVTGGHALSMRSALPAGSTQELLDWLVSNDSPFHGGTLLYRKKFAGLYSKVLAHTNDIGEDQLWQHFAKKAGARFVRCPLSHSIHLHLAENWPSKYASLLSTVVGLIDVPSSCGS